MMKKRQVADKTVIKYIKCVSLKRVYKYKYYF